MIERFVNALFVRRDKRGKLRGKEYTLKHEDVLRMEDQVLEGHRQGRRTEFKVVDENGVQNYDDVLVEINRFRR